ncbi:MAG TPA: diguanylate cyclase [Pilimelia sp.]|nr:diguanylate cyclase [Pilimelia sp.]
MTSLGGEPDGVLRLVTDGLTGCRTRATLTGRVEALLVEATRTGEHCAMFLFDVDYFKSVNDAYGHTRGDEILMAVVARVISLVREQDELFRYGGDEFVLLLPGADHDQAFDVARRIVAGVRGTPFPGDPPLSVSVSLGVAIFPDEATDAPGLIAVADRRNNLAKRRGRAQAVADDTVGEGDADVSSRLLERDAALSAVHDFLARLADEERGTLSIYGPPGCGHTRFLTEVANIGRLRGFAVRTGSDVADLVRAGSGATPARRPPSITEGWGEASSIGILIVLDRGDDAIDAARAALRRAPAGTVVGLVHAVAGTRPPVHRGAGRLVGAAIELTPWSPAALRTWLRTTLRGEPEPDLVDWLDGHSGGLPALAARELNRLVERAALERGATGGWTLTAAVRSEARRRGQMTTPDVYPPASRVCQLPPHIPDFTGRVSEFGGLVELARKAAAGQFTGTPVASIFGQPGVGKTTLAIHLAYALAEYFPDGQWYVDLRGTDDRPLEPTEALGRLLTALDMPPDRIPVDATERSSSYRSLTHNRRLLVVLDNAVSEAQVRPLLPSGPNILVFVTSRRSLAGLEGARRLLLEMLTADEAVNLLAHIVGPARVAAETAAAYEVARLCGFLPLALRIAGNRLASRPGWTIEYLARQLRDDQHRLAVLTAGDLQVRSTFAVSYEHLTDRTRAGFGRLSLAPGPEFDAALARVLVEADAVETEAILDELVDASLIEPASVPGRYRFHDLLRIFARERLAGHDDEATVRASEQRALAWLLDAATRAALLVGPNNDDCPQPDAPGPGAARFAGWAAAVSWLDTEWGNWLGALRRAPDFGMQQEVMRLAWAMHWYSDIRTNRGEWREVFTLGLEAARVVGDRNAECVLLDYLAWAHSVSERVEAAEPLLTEALALAREIGNRKEEGWALMYLGNCAARTGRPEPAMDRYRQAIEVFRGIDFDIGLCCALSHLGEALRRSGRLADCLRYHEQALAAARRDGSPIGMGLISFRMGGALADSGRLREAARRYTDAVSGFRLAGDIGGEGEALYSLGLVQADLDDGNAAVASLEAAVRIFRQIRDLRQQAVALRTLGEMMKNRRQDGPALAYERQAAAILAQLDTPSVAEACF